MALVNPVITPSEEVTNREHSWLARQRQAVVAFTNFLAQTGLAAALSSALAYKKVGGKSTGASLLLYYLWCFFDQTPYKDGLPSKYFRNFSFWKHLRDYYPSRLIKTHDLPVDNKQTYIFGVHPHGILSLSVPPTFGSDATEFSKQFPGMDVRVAIVNAPFYYPIAREIALLSGCISCDKKTILHNIGAGRSVAIVVGGADEALVTGCGTMKLILADRAGFVKVAIESGSSLVPCISFGENLTFKQVFSKRLRGLQVIMQKLMGFSLPMFYTVPFVILPKRVPLSMVVGSPIPVPKIDAKKHPDEFKKAVNHYHQVYIQAIKDLHAKYAPVYGSQEDQNLEICTTKESRSPEMARRMRLRACL